MSKIEIGRWSAQLRRMLGMKGVSDVSTELSPEISPTFQLEGPTAEWDFLKGVRLCSASTTLLGVAPNQSVIRLRNPPASGVIAIVQAISYRLPATTGASIQKGVSALDLATVRLTALRDERWAPAVPGLNRSVLILSRTDAGGIPVGPDVLWSMTSLGNSIIRYPSPVILTPGTHIDVSTDGGNVALDVSFSWSEREVSALEL